MLARARAATTFPLIVLIGGFGFSAAINLMATWGSAPLMMGGVMCSLAVPAAIELWPRIPANPNGWGVRRIVRGLIMTALALLAAYVTFRHGATVMATPGDASAWDEVTAYFYTLITESLMILGVMALRAEQAKRAAEKAERDRLALDATQVARVPDVPAPDPVVQTAEVPAEPVEPQGPPVQTPTGRRLAPVGGSKLDLVRAAYEAMAREVLGKGGSLDDIVAAEVDRRAGVAVGYAKKHINTGEKWRARFESERAVS